MSDRTEDNVKEHVSTKSERHLYTRLPQQDHSISESQKLSPTQWPQIPDVAFGLADATETKTWTFDEWFIPPIGSGRTIIDLWWQPKLVLVRTTSTTGARVLYIGIETNIRVWNPFVQGSEAVLSATILDVDQHFVFGTFPSGCGVSTWVARKANVRDDIFDAAYKAQLNMSAFRFIYC
jgi:hypothetical protein